MYDRVTDRNMSQNEACINSSGAVAEILIVRYDNDVGPRRTVKDFVLREMIELNMINDVRPMPAGMGSS